MVFDDGSAGSEGAPAYHKHPGTRLAMHDKHGSSFDRISMTRHVLSLLLLAAASLASAATIEVRVSNVAGGKGAVNVAVCDRERFLKQCAYSASVPARAGETVVLVEGVPPGAWAVLAYQDENENKELDRNLIGIPKENYGFSRDAMSMFGPPSFEAAAIDVRGDSAVAAIRLH
jgi:uncharacterized protein (DUF2141 family)